MLKNYAYTLHIWPSLITVLLLLVLSAYSWRRRSVPGALPFAIASLVTSFWMIGSGLETSAVDMATKIFWVKFQAAWQLPATTAIACFILEYTWPGRWLTRRNLALLCIAPLLFFVLVVTSNLHHLMWRGFIFNSILIPLRSPILWLFITYGYGLGILNLIVFGWLFLRSPQHRWPVAIMLTGQLAARILYLLEAIQIVRSGLPIDVLVIVLVLPMYAIALFGFRILDPVTLARQTVITQMRDGMLVLDLQGRVASLNEAASAILGAPEKRLLGRPVLDLLPEYTKWIDDSLNAEASQTGINFINLENGPETRDYMLETSILRDWRGLEAGRLLLLRDVTIQKQAQAQVVEQQRALAILQERERLARELHDGIGQVLGYVSMEAQAIRKRFQDGDIQAVGGQLSRLASTAQAAHADIRKSIFSLNTGANETWSFRTALQQYLNSYRENYGIQTKLSVPEGLGEGWFEPETEVQLMRVIQETLTNAHKHGKAGFVEINFIVQENGMHILIVDDGAGFDPKAFTEGEPGHYGLRFMRERVEQIGGRLTICSQPGAGTRVEIVLPRNSR